METRKLYDEDPFLRQFTAQVVDCREEKGAWTVVLDQTAFYPEGGGQGADWGTLSGVSVTDVHEKDGIILHTCAAPLETGSTVRGALDWLRRFDHMQQHSGEHILSGILCRRFHCDNVGFHLGSDTVTIDYNADISWEEALAAEAEANRRIWEDRPVEIAYPSPEELAALPYRSKKELTGAVRIVTFPEADCCACCGTHVARSGQVGLVKILSCQKFREGVRMEILCGERALRYLGEAYRQSRTIGRRLSVKPLEAAEAVEHLEAELAALKARTAALEQEVFHRIAQEYAGAGEALLIREPLPAGGARRLADAVGHTCRGLAAVFAGKGESYVYALVQGDGGDIAPLVKAMNSALHGQGGGRNGFAQGSVQASEAEIRRFFQENRT